MNATRQFAELIGVSSFFFFFLVFGKNVKQENNNIRQKPTGESVKDERAQKEVKENTAPPRRDWRRRRVDETMRSAARRDKPCASDTSVTTARMTSRRRGGEVWAGSDRVAAHSAAITAQTQHGRNKMQKSKKIEKKKKVCLLLIFGRNFKKTVLQMFESVRLFRNNKWI